VAVTAIATETVVLARQDPLKRAIAVDRARRNVVVVVPHSGTIQRDDTIEIAGHPNQPRHPPSPLKSPFNPKTRGSAG
jgi:hypothetical protein